MSITDIVTNIDQRLAELDTELTDLTRARAALVDLQTAPAPAPRASRRAAAQPPRKARRAKVTPAASEVVPAGKLVALLANSQGMTTRELSRATNGDPTQLLALLKEQEGAGQVRRSGVRASTRWHAITDEDRIAARAAELRAASRQTRARRS